MTSCFQLISTSLSCLLQRSFCESPSCAVQITLTSSNIQGVRTKNLIKSTVWEDQKSISSPSRPQLHKDTLSTVSECCAINLAYQKSVELWWFFAPVRSGRKNQLRLWTSSTPLVWWTSSLMFMNADTEDHSRICGLYLALKLSDLAFSKLDPPHVRIFFFDITQFGETLSASSMPTHFLSFIVTNWVGTESLSKKHCIYLPWIWVRSAFRNLWAKTFSSSSVRPPGNKACWELRDLGRFL